MFFFFTVHSLVPDIGSVLIVSNRECERDPGPVASPAATSPCVCEDKSFPSPKWNLCISIHRQADAKDKDAAKLHVGSSMALP